MRSNKQDSDDKMTKFTFEFKIMIAEITDLINTYKHSPTHKDSPNPRYPTTLVSYNRRAPPLYGGESMKISGMWTLKHEISLPRLYELLIKT